MSDRVTIGNVPVGKTVEYTHPRTFKLERGEILDQLPAEKHMSACTELRMASGNTCFVSPQVTVTVVPAA